jgi:16S rRNA (guanine966-N2)-methyltransferase
VRVIAGIAKGRQLLGPKSHAIRPALDKVKGAIFNILFDVAGLTVLDIFAGTGAIGIEALSRGAKRAVFLDASPEALAIIKKNLDLCRFSDQATILRSKLPEDLRTVAKRSGLAAFDLIFVDPPYDRELVNPTLEVIAKNNLLAPEGKIIVEHSPRETIASEYRLDRIHSGQSNAASDKTTSRQMEFQGRAVSPLTLYDQRKYGQTIISFLSRSQHTEAIPENRCRG